MTISIDLRQYGPGNGRAVVSDPGGRLDDLDEREVLTLLKESGYLLLRGFDADLDKFNAFVRRLSSVVVSDPAREFFGEGQVAQKVDAGSLALGLHLENGNSPFMPDLTWFFCQVAAESGSQTTVCDGYRIWDALPESSRAAWTAQDIVYSRTVPKRAWQGLGAHLLGGAKKAEDITLDDIAPLIPDPDRTQFRPNDDGSVHYAYRAPAVPPATLFDDRPAWANSIFGPSFNYEQPRITWADGSEIPAELMSEAETISDAVTEDVDWEHGDVALIDNTRVMHGRRAITDPRRTIFNAQSYVNRAFLGKVE
jgi:alpha-ketoglutarate-dependent taurine dioxygenase